MSQARRSAEPHAEHARPAAAGRRTRPRPAEAAHAGGPGNQALVHGAAAPAAPIRLSRRGDADEQAAERLVSGADPATARGPARAAEPSAAAGTPWAAALAHGTALPAAERAPFEQAFGADLGGVRIHTDPAAARSAQQLGARAYTRGSDIAFAPGEYAPGSEAGRRLLAHELAHAALAGEGHAQVRREQGGAAPPAAAPSTSAVSAPGPADDGQMELNESASFEREHRGELEITRQNRLKYQRRVRIRTRDGIDATLTFNATVDLGFTADLTRAPLAAIDDLGRVEWGYAVFGTRADGTPIVGLDIQSGVEATLRLAAQRGPRFLHFGLTPEEQYRALLEAVRDTSPEPGRGRPGEPSRGAQGAPRGERRVVTEEDFREMTPTERRQLAEQVFREEFKWSNVLKNVLIGVGIALVALGAIAAALLGAAGLALVLLGATLLAALVGLVLILWQTVSEIIERFRRSEWFEALLTLVRGVLQVVAVVAGALALIGGVVALILGAPLEIGALVVVAIAAAVGAAAISLWLAHLDFERAVGSESLEQFTETIARSAREAEGAASDTIVLIVTVVLGGIGRAVLGRMRPPVVEIGPAPSGEAPLLRPPVEGPEVAPRPLPEPLRGPPWHQRAPRYMVRTDVQNPPAMDPQRTAQMGQILRGYRSRPGVPRRVMEPGVPEPVRGGCAAVAQTDIPTLQNRSFGGASPEALPPGMRGRPGTSGGSVLRPVNPTAVDHAEQVSLENLRAAIDLALAEGRITRGTLQGRTVYLLVEQEPCPSCAAGAGGGAPGVLQQFSMRYPELTLEVRSPATARAYIYRGGVLLNP